MTTEIGRGKELAAGTPFGRYEIVRSIGKGGMATVYEARHVDLAKRVALKTLHRWLALRIDIVQRFVQEARTASRLEHPHVLGISDIGVEQGVPFMAMDLLEGEELTAVIHREKVLPIQRIADVMLPVISAVAAAHDKGILHRDLKPENIFLAKRRLREHPVLLDFGISKIRDAATKGLTAAEEILGTPPYMSPEQVQLGMDRFDARSDQYAIGVILYECATGRQPYHHDETMALLVQIARGGAPPPSAHRATIPKAFDALVARAMSMKPEDRFPSVMDLGRALYPFASKGVQALWVEEFGSGEPPPSAAVSQRGVSVPLRPADLRAVPCLAECSDAALAELAALAPGRRFAAGSLLFEQGSPPESCFLVLSGQVDLSRMTSKGVEGRASLEPGAIAGALSLVAGGPRAASATARTDVTVLEIKRDLWERLPDKQLEVATRLCDHLALLAIQRLRAATTRLSVLLDEGDRAGSPRTRELVRLQTAIAEWSAPMEDTAPTRRRDDPPPRATRRER